MKNLVEAVIKVMESCKNIEKSMTVGDGKFSYKGVSDKDVKNIVGEAMRANGLIILPTKVTPIHKIDRWEETTNYGAKQKQSVFTEVITEYELYHISGEHITLSGYGHGVDSQDKAAGKATTYAMKYTLLYSFMVATGTIDDADNTHSNDIEAPKAQPKQPSKGKVKPTETVWNRAIEKLKTGETDKTAVLGALDLTDEQIKVINEL